MKNSFFPVVQPCKTPKSFQKYVLQCCNSMKCFQKYVLQCCNSMKCFQKCVLQCCNSMFSFQKHVLQCYNSKFSKLLAVVQCCNYSFSKLLAVVQCCNYSFPKLLAVATRFAVSPAEAASLYGSTSCSYTHSFDSFSIGSPVSRSLSVQRRYRFCQTNRTTKMATTVPTMMLMTCHVGVTGSPYTSPSSSIRQTHMCSIRRPITTSNTVHFIFSFLVIAALFVYLPQKPVLAGVSLISISSSGARLVLV